MTKLKYCQKTTDEQENKRKDHTRWILDNTETITNETIVKLIPSYIRTVISTTKMDKEGIAVTMKKKTQ